MLTEKTKRVMASCIKFQLKVAEHSFAGVNGNARDGACFKLEQTNMVAKKQWYTEDDFSKSTH